MWYFVLPFMPATRIETGPPPEGAGSAQVVMPYSLSTPNCTRTVRPSGTSMVYWATWTLAVAETMPEAMMMTKAEADLDGSLTLVAVTVAMEFWVTMGAV